MLLLALILPVSQISCSHNYDPDTLDLGFYQWNLWYDVSSEQDQNEPSCGWEEMDRGIGKLVRIPAMAADHFQEFAEEKSRGVLWYHCRFTLPENWEDRKVSLQINGASPMLGVFLNQQQIADYRGNESFITMDVSDSIYYTRDNHLALRIAIKDNMNWKSIGISESVVIKSFRDEQEIAGTVKD